MNKQSPTIGNDSDLCAEAVIRGGHRHRGKAISPSSKVTPTSSTTAEVCASANAPFVNFDSAPKFSFNGGMANIALEVVRFSPPLNGNGVAVDRVTVAHLRMTIDAMRSLLAAIEGVEHLALMAHVQCAK